MRSIIHEPCVILADEPTASLDQPRKRQILELLLGLAERGHTIIVVTHDQLFYDVGRQYQMLDGHIIIVEPTDDAQNNASHHGQDEPVAADQKLDMQPQFPAAGASLLWGWRPRSAPMTLLRQALRETFLRWLFLILILSALVAGVTQISVFSSIITGAEVIVDKAFTEGSRLNRLEIKPKLADLKSQRRFPIAKEIEHWENVQHVVPRRQTIARLTNLRGEQISYVAMGLHDDDPEYKLLDFLAGGNFSRGVDKLELIVTATLLADFFDTKGLGEEGGLSYGDFIGRRLTMYVNRYSPSGALLKQEQVALKIAGVILHAEGGRQIYLPNSTQIIFDRVVADKHSRIELPVTEDGLDWDENYDLRAKLLEGPWEDKLQVYTTGVREIIPVIKQLAEKGYKSKSDIWDFKWALDIQDIAWKIFTPLLVLIIVAVVLTVLANIYTSAKLREREFALWRILGMRRGDLALLQITAAIFAVLMGSVIGLCVAWLVVNQSKGFLAAQYVEEGFDQIFAPVEQFFGLILAGALVVGIAAAVAPALRTARVDPARVLQS